MNQDNSENKRCEICGAKPAKAVIGGYACRNCIRARHQVIKDENGKVKFITSSDEDSDWYD